MMHKAWSRIEEVPYCFSRSYIKLQGHTALKIVKFDPNWAFPDCNSSLKSAMHWGEPHDGCSCNHRHHGRGRRWAHFNISVGVPWQSSQCLIFCTRYIVRHRKKPCNHCWCRCRHPRFFWLFDEENIRRHDGCSKWWRWLTQLIGRSGSWWRGLHEVLTNLSHWNSSTQICFKYFWKVP